MLQNVEALLPGEETIGGDSSVMSYHWPVPPAVGDECRSTGAQQGFPETAHTSREVEEHSG